MNTTILISRTIDADRRKTLFEEAVIGTLLQSGYSVASVLDVYSLPDRSKVWQELAAVDKKAVLISWLYPRPAEALLKQNGLAPTAVFFLGSYETPEDCAADIAKAVPAPGGSGTLTRIRADSSDRWYPIIDKSRCTNCGHCMQFCLFDVYGTDAEGGIVVANPDNCKPGCPACSRVCPESAIIFPLYQKDEAIAGAPGKFVTPDTTVRPAERKRVTASEPVSNDAQDDIDLLINDLENLTKRRP